MFSIGQLIRSPSRLRRRARRTRMATFLLVAVIGSIIIAPFYIVYKPPALLINYFQHRWQDVLWQVTTTEKVVALTIDDAPSDHTDAILKVLKENNASSTFFIIGSQAQNHMGLLGNIVQNGNELGNHAMHDEPSRALSNTALTEQIIQVESMISEIYSKLEMRTPPKYFRPGSGFFNKRLRNLVRAMDYRLVLGGVYPHDPQVKKWQMNARHILSMVRPGAIIICHDRRSWTVPMLAHVLPELRRQGYTITTITGLLQSANTVNTQ